MSLPVSRVSNCVPTILNEQQQSQRLYKVHSVGQGEKNRLTPTTSG